MTQLAHRVHPDARLPQEIEVGRERRDGGAVEADDQVHRRERRMLAQQWPPSNRWAAARFQYLRPQELGGIENVIARIERSFGLQNSIRY